MLHYQSVYRWHHIAYLVRISVKLNYISTWSTRGSAITDEFLNAIYGILIFIHSIFCAAVNNIFVFCVNHVFQIDPAEFDYLL